MLVLGIETSCDETGVALYDTVRAAGTPLAGLLGHAIHSQVAMHDEYGGVVPELASRDHIRRVLPLCRKVAAGAGVSMGDLDAVAYTQGPGLAGALLVGASVASALAYSLGIPAVPVHHLEGHLLSPLLSKNPPAFPFVALLVSGGHTQLMRVAAVGDYALLGETLDDAAGEAFDKSAKLLGLAYPGGPALSRLAQTGKAGRFRLPRPMQKSPDLDFSFSGLKTAVLLAARAPGFGEADRADLAHAVEEAIVDVLVSKSLSALERTGMDSLVVAGGVGANRLLRATLDAAAIRRGFCVYYPEMELCTDNGAMIALVGALRLQSSGIQSGIPGVAAFAANDTTLAPARGFTVKPRWDLASL